jgi:hypothetical protein
MVRFLLRRETTHQSFVRPILGTQARALALNRAGLHKHGPRYHIFREEGAIDGALDGGGIFHTVRVMVLAVVMMA